MSVPFIGLGPLLLAWVGCFGLCRELAARKKILSDWRLSWILACAAWGALLTLVVEGCSVLRQLNTSTPFIIWAVLGASFAGTAAVLARKRGALSHAAWTQIRDRINQDWTQHWPLDAKLMLGASVVLILLLGAMAAIFPTTNWDSLTYHLPRVMHWLQQQSVEHYPTHNTRQIEFGPWSGFVLAQLHLLVRSDQLDNLVQWFAMLSCVIVGSLISQQLLELSAKAGSSAAEPDSTRNGALRVRRTMALCCLLVTTLPTGIVESTTTQTDYVVTCWLIGLTSLLLALWREPANLWYALGAGLALALGVLTKASMLIYAAPLGVALAIWPLVRPRNNWLRLPLALIFIGCLVTLNAPHWLRNYGIFGSPLGSRHIMSAERNATLSVGGTLSNVIRNLSLQINTGYQPLTDAINQIFLKLHRFTGRDLNDPETTYHVGAFGSLGNSYLDDSHSSNFYHLLLISVAALALARDPRKHLMLFAYVSMAIAGFVLFCVFLRWQIFHSRIHLAWFVLLMPWVGTIVIGSLPNWFARLAAAGVFVFAAYCLVNNRSRLLNGLDAEVFSRDFPKVVLRRTRVHEPLAAAAHDIVISQCRQVGLHLEFDDPEYPVWLLLRNRGFTGELDDFAVENESARIGQTVPEPCAVLSTSTTIPAGITNLFPFHSEYGLIRVFWSEGASRWAELAQVANRTQTARWLSRQADRVEFEGQTITFALRTVRAGYLRLAGLIKDSKGRPLDQGSLQVATQPGFEQTRALAGWPISLAVPSTGGRCVIQVNLTASPSTSTALWDQFEWSWQPE